MVSNETELLIKCIRYRLSIVNLKRESHVNLLRIQSAVAFTLLIAFWTILVSAAITERIIMFLSDENKYDLTTKVYAHSLEIFSKTITNGYDSRYGSLENEKFQTRLLNAMRKITNAPISYASGWRNMYRRSNRRLFAQYIDGSILSTTHLCWARKR